VTDCFIYTGHQITVNTLITWLFLKGVKIALILDDEQTPEVTEDSQENVRRP
jgi:hypothetical protein